MGAPEFVPLKANRQTRSYSSPPRRPESWVADRPGDLNARQPSGDRGTQTQALAEAYAERIAGFVSRHPTNVPNFRYSVRLGAARKGHS